MSTSDQQNTTQTAVSEDESIDDRLDRIEDELANLREHVERIDKLSVNESVMNLLIDAIVGDAADVEFQAEPGQNREALTTVDERLTNLETTVELLQHQNAEVSE